MKKMIKYSNYFGLVLALCLMVFSGCSCTTAKQDPLAGFHVVDLRDLHSNKTITDDYNDYLQKLPPNEVNYAGMNGYYGDDTGQHVVLIEVDLKGTAWFHALFYNKDNRRIKVIKYVGYHYAS